MYVVNAVQGSRSLRTEQTINRTDFGLGSKVDIKFHISFR